MLDTGTARYGNALTSWLSNPRPKTSGQTDGRPPQRTTEFSIAASCTGGESRAEVFPAPDPRPAAQQPAQGQPDQHPRHDDVQPRVQGLGPAFIYHSLP